KLHAAGIRAERARRVVPLAADRVGRFHGGVFFAEQPLAAVRQYDTPAVPPRDVAGFVKLAVQRKRDRHGRIGRYAFAFVHIQLAHIVGRIELGGAKAPLDPLVLGVLAGGYDRVNGVRGVVIDGDGLGGDADFVVFVVFARDQAGRGGRHADHGSGVGRVRTV